MRFIGGLLNFLLACAAFAIFAIVVEVIRHPLIPLAIGVLLVLRAPVGGLLKRSSEPNEEGQDIHD